MTYFDEEFFKIEKKTEVHFSNELKEFFLNQNWSFLTEKNTKSKKRIDFLVSANKINFGVECKKNLNDDTSLSELADYFEQCIGYSKDLNMPIFLGPYHTEKSLSDISCGGIKIPPINSFVILGGRANVGLIVHQRNRTRNRWFLNLRGSYFWEQSEGFKNDALKFITSTGSKKERVSILGLESNPQ
jgi:ribosomal protein L28